MLVGPASAKDTKGSHSKPGRDKQSTPGQYKDYGHLPAPGPTVKLSSSKSSAGAPVSDVANQVSQVSKVVLAKTGPAKTGKKSKIKWIRRKPTQKGVADRPDSVGGWNLYRELAARLSGRTQGAHDSGSRPASTPKRNNIVAFPKAGVRNNDKKSPATKGRRRASKTGTSDIVIGEQTVVGSDANGLPRYVVRIPGKPRLLRHLARFMEAMGAECMPTSDGSTVYASGTLSCLLMPGTNSRYVGKRQRLVDYLKNQLYALREKGQVTDTAVEDTSHLLSNASSFIVGSDGKIRLVPQVAVDLYKQSGFLASGEAGDYHSAATVGDGA